MSENISARRNDGIDSMKGMLILLMITGHILQGKVMDNFFRFIIYSFHMPLFIGIGGYLMANSKTIKLSLRSFWMRLLKRPVWPWLIAMLAYSLLPNLAQVSNMKELFVLLMKCFIFPYHHLWFIPAYLGWIIGLKILQYFFKNPGLVFSASLLISILFFPVDHHLIFLDWVPRGYSVLHYIGRTFHIQFFFFFVLAFVSFRSKSTFPLRFNLLLLLLLFWAYSFTSHNEIWLIAGPVYYVFNFTFVQVFFQLVREEKLPQLPVLAEVGKNSLPVYLWHIFPIVYTGLMFPDYSDYKFYLMAFALELILIGLILRLSHYPLIDRYLFGNFGSDKGLKTESR